MGDTGKNGVLHIESITYKCSGKAKPTTKPANCGAPQVNWKTANDSTAPKGWKTSGFSGNVGNSRSCGNGWNAYRGGSGQGTLYATLKGSGTLTAKFRDCWKEGTASIYLNNKLKGSSKNRSGQWKIQTLAFKNGDKLSFKDTGSNGVLHIESITYKCSGGKPGPKPKACGAPQVNWKTAKDSTAPKGWKVSGFSGNVGNSRSCGNGWNAYRGASGQGTLYTTLKGSGTLTAKFRDCWKEGTASIYLNNKLKGSSKNRSGQWKIQTLAFKNGDKLSFKDTGSNGVLHIESITYKCS